MNQLLELVQKVADYVYCSEQEEEMCQSPPSD